MLRCSSLGPKAVTADCQGGRLSADAGVLLLRQVAQDTGIFPALDAAVADPRFALLIIHTQESLLAQRIRALASGSEDLNDPQDLRNDPALQVAAGKLPDDPVPLASPPTLSRLENRVDRQSLLRTSQRTATPSVDVRGRGRPPGGSPQRVHGTMGGVSQPPGGPGFRP